MYYGVANTVFCVATPFRPPSKEKRQAGGRNHSSRPASTASLATDKGTSCGPLICYALVAIHGRSVPSVRVIVVVLPLPSALNVFPSVEPTTIVNVCIRRNKLLCCISFQLSYLVVYPSNCHVIILSDVGGGFRWRDTRAAAPAAASRLLSYCQNPGAPPPSRLARALTHAVSGDRDPQL